MSDTKERREYQRVKKDALRRSIFILQLLVTAPGSRKITYVCRQLSQGAWLCGKCGFGRIRPKQGIKCECGARVHKVDRRIDVTGYSQLMNAWLRNKRAGEMR